VTTRTRNEKLILLLLRKVIPSERQRKQKSKTLCSKNLSRCAFQSSKCSPDPRRAHNILVQYVVQGGTKFVASRLVVCTFGEMTTQPGDLSFHACESTIITFLSINYEIILVEKIQRGTCSKKSLYRQECIAIHFCFYKSTHHTQATHDTTT